MGESLGNSRRFGEKGRLLKFDREVPCHTFCCNRLWVNGVSLAQIAPRFARDCRVVNQTTTPSTRVNVAQKTASHPWARSQPRFCGRKSAGKENRKVIKTNMAFTTPPRWTD